MNRVLFWDFHGTLTHPDKLWSINVWRAARELLPDCPVTLENVIACLDNDGFPWHHPEQARPDLTEPRLWWEHVDRLFYNTLLRCGLTDKEAGSATPHIREKILDVRNYRLFEQAGEVLAALRKAGWRHYMVSNNFPELQELCGALGIAPYFSGFITSALVGYEKPRREIFEQALDKAGRPERCFMVGDNPVADMLGAHNAGIPGILVHTAASADASFACHSLHEVCALLLQPALLA